MHQILIFYHSLFRWFLLLTIIYSIYRACRGLIQNLFFSKLDNLIRYLTVTIAHIQFIIGIVLYTNSSSVSFFWKNLDETLYDINDVFFGLIHIILMLSAIIVLTIGSSLTKRKLRDKEKFKTILIWYSIVLLIIFIAIPWPFSPLANRPYIR